MKNNAAVIGFLGILLIAGCAPSVRYTRDRPGSQPVGQSDKKPRSPDFGRQEAVEEGVDSSQSGWEAFEGGAERHQSDWLTAALREADQGPSGRQEGARVGDSQRLRQVINAYMGVPYRYGGTTRRGFDCSGFVSAVYNEVYGIPLKRTSGAMWKDGTPVALSAARPGDLVFFKGGTFGTIDHVGIYMGLTRFAHSSTTSGVIYSNLKETYYARRFAGIRRMF
ncbi:MAG: C40 family peptidase [Chitinispirillales bacterium]|jgi:cell wall-associated NlpC family hydrolase|nr:C40 family peptidase [Chitinispirillales bacterium]